jgi:internalin A
MENKTTETANKALKRYIFVDLEESLVEVNLERSMVTDSVLEDLKLLDNVHRLFLNFTMVTDKIMEVFEVHPEIKQLDISNTQITDDGLRYLKFAQSLEILYLGERITDQAVDYIKEVPNLKTLDVSDTSISVQGLIKLTALSNLTFLSLSKAQVSDESIAALKGAKMLDKLHLALAEDDDPVFQKLQRSIPGIKMDW